MKQIVPYERGWIGRNRSTQKQSLCLHKQTDQFSIRLYIARQADKKCTASSQNQRITLPLTHRKIIPGRKKHNSFINLKLLPSWGKRLRKFYPPSKYGPLQVVCAAFRAPPARGQSSLSACPRKRLRRRGEDGSGVNFQGKILTQASAALFFTTKLFNPAEKTRSIFDYYRIAFRPM